MSKAIGSLLIKDNEIEYMAVVIDNIKKLCGSRLLDRVI
jgi:hypothetical protein